MLRSILVLLALMVLPLAASAHAASDSYLTLRGNDGSISGRWDIALRDLDHAIGLDADGDGRIVWGEVRTRADEIAGFALAQLGVYADGTLCTQAASASKIARHGDAAYVVLALELACAPEAAVSIDYALFGELDPEHRGLLKFEWDEQTVTHVLAADLPALDVDLRSADSLRSFRAYVAEGIHHIWIGFDHLLFLLCLLLPAVLGPASGATRTLRSVSLHVAKLVTAFTLAHSVTLALATFELVVLPARAVESVIAASVVLVALNNLRPVVRETWALAFGFGLVHGFGFAGVLGELGLPPHALAPALLGFNVGVEFGQLALVAAVLPVAFVLRDTRLYRQGLLPVASVAMAVIASLWLVERALAVELVAWL